MTPRKSSFSVCWDTLPAFYGHNLLLPAPRGFIRHHKHTKFCWAKKSYGFCLLFRTLALIEYILTLVYHEV